MGVIGHGEFALGIDLPQVMDVARTARVFERLQPLAEMRYLPKAGRDSLRITMVDAAADYAALALQLEAAYKRLSAKGDNNGMKDAVGAWYEIQAVAKAANQTVEGVEAIHASRPIRALFRPRYDLHAVVPNLQTATQHALLGKEYIDKIPAEALAGTRALGSKEPRSLPDWMPMDPWVTRKVDGFQRGLKKLVRKIAPNAVHVMGAEKLPDGPFIIAATHGSNLDGMYYAVGTDRTVRFMANKKLLDTPILGNFVARGGAYPVGFGKSQRAIGITRAIGQDGGVIFMAPEKRMLYGDHPGKFHSGVALIALFDGIPVVPASSAGTKKPFTRLEKMWPFGHRHAMVEFGDPISFKDLKLTMNNVEGATELIAQRVDAVHEHVRAQRLAELGRAK